MSEWEAGSICDELAGEGRTTPARVRTMVRGITQGTVTDAQASAWLMAIRCRGLDEDCQVALVESMVDSGVRLRWDTDRPVVDKHSTGGVGDKVSLVAAPLAASLGLAVPMLSGRGLGHTGGTLDKLEAIEGFTVELDSERAQRVLRECGCFIAGAGSDLVPADGRMYALRDHIGAVASVPLIASSIMSKKIAGGADGLVVDTRYGSGAFLADRGRARELAGCMQSMATATGVRFAALLSSHDRVLGASAGNGCEVAEALEVLAGGGPEDVVDWAVTVVEMMGAVVGVELDGARCRQALADGSAMEVFERMVAAQGGNLSAGLAEPAERVEVCAGTAGYVDLRARDVAEAAWVAGAGRRRVGERVDATAGVRVLAGRTDLVGVGDVVAVVHGADRALVNQAAVKLARALGSGETPVPADGHEVYQGGER